MTTRGREISRSPVTTHWRWVERLLWVVATGLLGFSAFMLIEGKLYEFYLNSQFEDALNEQQLKSAQHTSEFLKSASAIARSAPEPYLGRVDIPRLDLSVMFQQQRPVLRLEQQRCQNRNHEGPHACPTFVSRCARTQRYCRPISRRDL